MTKKPGSLRSGLLTTIVLCWLLPLVIVVAMAGILVGDSYRRSIQQELDNAAERALDQVEMNLSAAITDCKAVSYDGVIRSAYRSYRETGDRAELYRRSNEYLSQCFSRSDRYEAVFLRFWDEETILSPYLITKGTASHSILLSYQTDLDTLMAAMKDVDTGILFLILDGRMYMARNLLDTHFVPYASVFDRLDPHVVFFPLESVGRTDDAQIFLDDCRFRVTPEGLLEELPEDAPRGDLHYEVEVDGHALAFEADPRGDNVWTEIPWMGWAVSLVALLVFLPLILVGWLFFRSVTQPMEVLAGANRQIQEGRRGYTITEPAPNAEFQKLYDHFNAMSTELSDQFERSYLEQQATQQAKIKTLQSQINPHFLNNTLEIINWEARLVGDERVSAMIEALSTMLDAALDRDGRTQISLKEELGYVDAYLYIIRQRLGEGLHIHKSIDEAILTQTIPRLLLQPLVENAVEHDLTARHGGELWIRAFRDSCRMVLEVEHDGSMTAEDREKVRALLAVDTSVKPSGSQVGLRNVSQRLHLIYGDDAVLELGETGNGTILAKIVFPV